MASRYYPEAVVMLCRVGVILGIPVVSDSPRFPDDPARRARWSPSVGAYVLAEKGASQPITCLSLHNNAIVLHENGCSGISEELTRTSTRKELAEAVWAWERIEGARRFLAGAK